MALFLMSIFYLMIFIISVYFDYNYGVVDKNNYLISGLSLGYLILGIVSLIGFGLVKYRGKEEIKKRYFWMVLGLFLVIVLFPIKLVYKDGGTKEYQSMIYKVIVWNRLNDGYEKGYKKGKEVHFLPFNFYPVDYYDDVRPESLFLTKSKSQSGGVMAETGTYCYGERVGKEMKHLCSDTISPVSANYRDELVVKKDEKIYLAGFDGYINKLELYRYGFKEDEKWNLNANEYLVNYNLTYDNEGKYIEVPDLDGEYVFVVAMNNEFGNVSYSFKIRIEKD